MAGRGARRRHRIERERKKGDPPGAVHPDARVAHSAGPSGSRVKENRHGIGGWRKGVGEVRAEHEFLEVKVRVPAIIEVGREAVRNGVPRRPHNGGHPVVFVAIHAGRQRVGVLLESTHLKRIFAEGHISQSAKNLHGGQEKGAAAIQVGLNHHLLRRGKGIMRAIVENGVVGSAPNHDREGLQIGELRRTPGGHFPKGVAEPCGVEGVGIGAVGDIGGAPLVFVPSGGVPVIHQQDGRSRRRDKAEVSPRVIIRGGIAGGIGRNEIEEIGRAGDQASQTDRMGSVQGEIGDGQVESRVRAVAIADNGTGGLGCLPGDSEDSHVGRHRHVADGGGDQVRHSPRHTLHLGAVLINGLDTIAMLEFQFAVGGGAPRHRSHCACECAVVAGGLEHDRFPVRLGRAAQHYADGIAGSAGRVENGQSKLARRGIGRAIQQHGSRSRARQVPGNDQREVLVNGSRFRRARILHNMPAADAHQVVARRRLRQMHGFHVVEDVGRGGIGRRIITRKLVAAVERPIGGDNFQVQIIHQCGNCPGKTVNVSVGQGDF